MRRFRARFPARYHLREHHHVAPQRVTTCPRSRHIVLTQSAMAIGVGLAYVLVIENLVFGCLGISVTRGLRSSGGSRSRTPSIFRVRLQGELRG
jgi:hypothetical protein